MSEEQKLILVHKDMYLASVKAMSVYLEQLTEDYENLRQEGYSDPELIDLVAQIEVVTQIYEGLVGSTMSKIESDSDGFVN